MVSLTRDVARPGPRRLAHSALFFLGAILLFWLIARWCFIVISPISFGVLGYDYAIFRASALALLAGRDPYELPGFDHNLNHPAIALWSVPFALLPASWGYVAWVVSGAASYLLTLGLAVRIAGVPRAVWRNPLSITIALTYLGLSTALIMGQISPFIAPLLVLAWGAHRGGRPVLAAALLGVAIPLKVALLPLGALLLVRPTWRAFVACGGAALAVCLVPLPLIGVAGYRHWFALLGAVDYATLNVTNMSIVGLIYRLAPDAPRALATIAYVAAALGGLAVARAAVPRGWHPTDWRFGALILIALLTSPIAWDHYGPFLIPVVATLLATWPRLARPVRIVAALGLLGLLGATELRMVAIMALSSEIALGTFLCLGLGLTLLAFVMGERVGEWASGRGRRVA